MKKILSLLSILSILLIFNSCSNEEGTIFDFEGKDYWSFLTASQSFEANETGKAIVYLYHLNPDAITPVNITCEYDNNSQGLLSVSQTSVSSIDEKNRTAIEITYKMSDLEYNVPYIVKVSVPEQTTYPIDKTLVTSATVTITRPLTFKNMGTGYFVSEAFEDEWNQPVQLADQAVIYRLPNLYDNGYNIMIEDNGNGTVTVKAQPGWYYSATYGDVYVRGNGVKEGKIITLSLEHIIWGIKHSFGFYEEILTLP